MSVRRTLPFAACLAGLTLPGTAAADPGARADEAAGRPRAAAPASVVAAPPRTFTLASGWEFRVAPTYEPAAPGWRRVSIPHVIDASLSKASFAGTVAWYRLRFRAPDAPVGFASALRFEEVRRKAVVYLNGTRIGRSDDPYTPFTVNARGLRKGAENELLVRVDNRLAPDFREGWWNWGGIVRPVELVPRGRITVSALGLLPRVSADRDRATLRIDALVANRTRRRIAPRLAVRLTSPSGRTLRQSFVLKPLSGRARRREVLNLRVSGRPELWSPTRPRLYRAEVRTTAGGATEQLDRERFGMRRIDVSKGRLYLNGRLLQARGVALHEDLPGRGPALTGADADELTREVQEAGANLVRVHYLFNERLLDRFDRAGILVWNEAPIFTRDGVLRRSSGRKEALGQLKRTVLAARNHPSVLVNSVANELANEPDKKTGTRRYLTDAAALARGLDPAVPVGVAIRSVPGTPRQRTYRGFDVIGFNHYLGWYPCPPAPQTSLGQLAPFVDELERLYPRQALVMSEFGAEATRTGPATKKDTFAFQSMFVRRTLDVVDRRPRLAGAVYWALREFAVRPRWDGGACRPADRRTSIHRKGLLDYRTAAPKPAWSVLRDRYRATPLYADAR